MKNSQKAIENILNISMEEQDKIVVDIITMLREDKQPSEFYDEIAFFKSEEDRVNLLAVCLEYQLQPNFNIVKSNELIKLMESNCANSKVFFSPWLKARAKVFEKGEELDKEEQEQVITGYREAFDKGIAYAGCYLSQFLVEAIQINSAFKPRNVKDINDFHGYGYTLEIFGDTKQKLLDLVKEFLCLRTSFFDLHYSDQTLRGQVCSKYFSDCLTPSEVKNKAIEFNNRGLELAKDGYDKEAICNFSQAILLNPLYINAYSSRGNAYKQIGNNKKALADFNLALLLNPNHTVTLYNRGVLWMKEYKFEYAIIDFNTIIENNPSDTEVSQFREFCHRMVMGRR